MVNEKLELTFKTFPYGWHPYLKCYSSAMNKFGISVVPGKVFNNKILDDTSLTGVHFHWTEYFWNSSNLLKNVKSILGILSFLREARKKRKIILWTVHNHKGHEGKLLLDYIGYKVIANFADLIIVHSKWSKNVIKKKFNPPGRIVLMYHGNFMSYFKCNESKENSQKHFGLDITKPTIGIIGTIRGYKGHDLAITACQEKNIQLFIAGKCYDDKFLQRLVLLDTNNIAIFYPKKLTDLEYASAINASDIILLPYRNITTSGALLASWSLGRSVIVPDHPYFREIIPKNSVVGYLFKNYKEIPFLFERLLSVPFNKRYHLCLEEAKKYEWDKVIVDLSREIKNLVKS
ncbi:hypothetical protein JCM12298_16290 [Desulfothermus naphthae]